ncbi:MAG: hypothetical protein NTX88_00240 [Candidatus Atribacteria bacterium]|nr:hypothetical protein [Candidatus Atribacteria bacterium]
MPKIYLLDVTNREGVQTAHLGLAKIEKTIVNMYLNEMGVYQSEFGFPTTRHETNYLNANLELSDLKVLSPIRLSGWMRAVKKDVEVAYQLVPKLKYMNLSISTSDQMLSGKFQGKMSRQDVIQSMVEATQFALQAGAEGVGVNAEDASRTDIDFLVEFAQAAKEAGEERFRYCDTLGYDSPFSIYDRILKIGDHFSGEVCQLFR